MIIQPDGSRDSPGLSCKELKLCHPDLDNGKMFYRVKCYLNVVNLVM